MPQTARVEPASYAGRADEWLVERCRAPMGRAVICAYALVAVATAVWLMRDLPVGSIVAAVDERLGGCGGERLCAAPPGRPVTGSSAGIIAVRPGL